MPPQRRLCHICSVGRRGWALEKGWWSQRMASSHDFRCSLIQSKVSLGNLSAPQTLPRCAQVKQNYCNKSVVKHRSKAIIPWLSCRVDQARLLELQMLAWNILNSLFVYLETQTKKHVSTNPCSSWVIYSRNLACPLYFENKLTLSLHFYGIFPY